MSPRIQDPRLNTAECVIKSHKKSMSAIPEEHRAYIKAMLWCSFGFTMLFGPTLAVIIFAFFHTENDNEEIDKISDIKNGSTEDKRPENKRKKEELAEAVEVEDKRPETKGRKEMLAKVVKVEDKRPEIKGRKEMQAKDVKVEDKRPENKRKKEKLGKAFKIVSFVLSIGESALLFTTIGFFKSGNTLWDLYVIPPLIFFEVLVLVIASHFAREKYEFFPGTTKIEFLAKVGTFLGTNMTMYYFCWLVIGIMINPLWGITVLLVLSIVIAVTVFLVFIVLHSNFDPMILVLCIFGGFSTVLLFTVVILAGQSFFIRETANEVVKAAILYFTTALIAWIISKVIGEKSEKSRKTNGEEKESKATKSKGKNERQYSSTSV